jgi:serine/threonine protein kinase
MEETLKEIVLDYYQLDKLIAEGSFGKIYISENVQTKEKYIAKLVSQNN